MRRRPSNGQARRHTGRARFVTSKDGTAEIYDMEDARRRRADGGDETDAGLMLKSAREAQSLSLSEAAARTHIKESCLEAIEAMNAAALPARPYAIGFVRGYAEFLDLDADRIVDLFKAGAGFEVSKPVEAKKFEVAEKAAPTEKPELSLLAVVAIIAFILWCAWQITLPREVRQIGASAAGEAPAEAAPIAPVAPPPANVVEATLIERIEPIYPMGCLDKAGAVETVALSLTVTPQGRVAGERIVSATNGCFSDAALIAVRRWKFEPRTVEGTPRSAHDQRFELTFRRPL